MSNSSRKAQLDSFPLEKKAVDDTRKIKSRKRGIGSKNMCLDQSGKMFWRLDKVGQHRLQELLPCVAIHVGN